MGHLTSDDDRITAKLPALHFYQLSLPAPAPPRGSFDAAAAERGDELFGGKARCTSCHTDELYSEPGWDLHRGEDLGIDNFQADRGPTIATGPRRSRVCGPTPRAGSFTTAASRLYSTW